MKLNYLGFIFLSLYCHCYSLEKTHDSSQMTSKNLELIQKEINIYSDKLQNLQLEENVPLLVISRYENYKKLFEELKIRYEIDISINVLNEIKIIYEKNNLFSFF